MKKETSAYLDLLRILAAFAVFVEHLSYGKISGGFLWQIGSFGHSAVIIFFVLSGFVIAFSAEQKEKTLLDFSVARFARLYSVVLPALLLTMVCDYVGTHHDPEAYYMDEEGEPAIKLGLGFLFLSQSWQSVHLLSDGSFWSLPYEFWYYQIFAASFFLRGWWRFAGITGAAIVAGPAILILFPIWLFGVLSYRVSKGFQFKRPKIVWSITMLAILAAAFWNQNPLHSSSVLLPTAFSILDYVIGAALAANIIAANQLGFGLTAFKRPIAYFAGMTFALYLFHLPLLHFVAAYVPRAWPVPVRGLLVATFTLAAVYLLSFITERQKLRWRSLFYWLFTRIGLIRINILSQHYGSYSEQQRRKSIGE